MVFRGRPVSEKSGHDDAAAKSSVGAGKREGAHLLGRTAPRVPVLPSSPHPLAYRLGLRPQLGEVDTGDAAALHAHYTVDDHGVDVIADTAVHQALDRIAHRPHAQRVATGEIDDDDVRLRARRQPPDVAAAD